MVDIVQSNETKLLIRKIGYSVGLESTLARFNQVIDLYVSKEQLSDPDWKNLASKGFNRDIKARVHFENLFAVLGVFSVDNGRPVAQLILDAAALLKRHYVDDAPAFERALRAVLLYSITLADGELFGALLSTDFDKHHYAARLSAFREHKLRIFYQNYKNKFDREKLNQVIDFEEIVPGIDGKSSKGATAGPFAGTRGVRKNRDTEDFSVSLSDDWFRKVPARRQAWAEDLGLFSKGAKTDAGRRYIDAMSSLIPPSYRSSTNSTAIVLMPLDAEMRERHVTWALGDDLVVAHSEFTQAICSTFLPTGSDGAKQRQVDLEATAKWALESFMKADKRFQMLRRELPFKVFSLLILGICAASGMKIGNLKSDLEALAREKRNILLRPSRGSIYGISFSRQ